MSVLPEGREIRCDGDGCFSTAPLPVALRRTLGGFADLSEAEGVRGWLFAGAQNARKHFCPRCGSQYLNQTLEGTFSAPAEATLQEAGNPA